MEEIDFGDWLEDQYRARGWTQKVFAQKLGVKNTTVSNWVNGVSPPSDANCVKIADVLGLDRNEVRERAGRPKAVELAARLEFGVNVGSRINVAVDTGETTAHQPLDIRYVPIIGTAAADSLRASWGAGDLYPVLRSDVQGMGSPVMMVVSGDCMEPRINDGDLVILDTTAEPVVGEVVAVRDGEDVTLKELWSDDGSEIVLRAIKAGYPPIRIAKEDQGAQLVGVVRRWIRSGRV